MKKYLMRSVRYMLRLIIIIVIALFLLYLTNTLNVGNKGFLHELIFSGKGAILMAVLVVLAGIYPRISFTSIDIRANLEENRERIIDVLNSYGYTVSTDNESEIVFRAESNLKKILSQWDDAITVTGEGNFITLEGLKKDVYRIELRLRSALNK